MRESTVEEGKDGKVGKDGRARDGKLVLTAGIGLHQAVLGEPCLSNGYLRRHQGMGAAANIAEGCAKKEEEWGRLEELHREAGGMTWLLYGSMLPKKVTGSAEQSP